MVSVCFSCVNVRPHMRPMIPIWLSVSGIWLQPRSILQDWVAYRYLQPRCLGLFLFLSLVLALALALVTEAGVEGKTSLALALVTGGGNGPGRSQQQQQRQLRPLPR